MFLLSFVIEKSFTVHVIEKSEFWLNLAVNACFTALFIISFFNKTLKRTGKKIFLCVAVLSFAPLVYKLLFLKALTFSDAKILFLKSVVFFSEYCLLSVHGEYPCKNCAPENNESLPATPPVCVRPAPTRKNVRIANVSEIPLRKTELIKMGRLNKLNGEYLKQCLFSLEDKKLSDKDLVDFYALKNDFLFSDGLLASGNRTEISDKCNRLIGLMSIYGV